jgi:hypothetical protein
MTRIEIKSRVGPDGVLNLNLPPALANHDVVVTVERVHAPDAELQPGDWQGFVDETAGRWAGEPLVRPRQDWQDFVDETYGSCAGLGLEVPPDFPAEGRQG